MRRFVLAAIFLTGAAGLAQAQSGPMTGLEIAVACAPPATVDAPASQDLRIIGSQDSEPRSLFGDRDLLVIGGGTTSGVELGQQFFVRRANSTHMSRGFRTLGWVRVVAVNDTTAIAMIDHICGAIISGDYLERYAAPVVPAGIDRDESTGQPDFTTLGRVLGGNEDRDTAGLGDFVLIDWGEKQGLMAGSRFAIYRDVGVGGIPLSSVGEGVVVATSGSTALTRVTRARDAVYVGDYIALRR